MSYVPVVEDVYDDSSSTTSSSDDDDENDEDDQDDDNVCEATPVSYTQLTLATIYAV